MGHEKDGPKAEEIEVTPEMLEAGLKELSFFDPSEDPEENWIETVRRVYVAMAVEKNK